MKKSLLVLSGVGVLCLLLILRLFFTQKSHVTNERIWFATALGYEFSAHVDSVRMFDNGTGRLWCMITSGDPQVSREDSLKRSFKEHDMLYLIFHRSGDSIIFLFPNGNLVSKGDSVRVSSRNNTIQFFRDGSPVAADELSNTLTGFNRPFFMQKK